jgi:hypothetical protein
VGPVGSPGHFFLWFDYGLAGGASFSFFPVEIQEVFNETVGPGAIFLTLKRNAKNIDLIPVPRPLLEHYRSINFKTQKIT